MTTSTTSWSEAQPSGRIHRWEMFTMIMLVLMDLSWITPVYSLIIGWSLGSSPVMVFLVFGVIYIASSLIASLPKYIDLFLGIIQLALLATLFLGVIWTASELIYFSDQLALGPTITRYFSRLIQFSIPLKPELVLALVVFLVWRRGFTIANRSMGLGLIRKSFRTGGIVLVVVGVFSALLGNDLPYLEAGLYMFTGLLAMGGARFSTLGSMRGSKRVAFKREWVAGLTLMALMVLTLSVGFGFFAAGPLSAWIGGFLIAAERYVSEVLKVILAPIINFLGIIFAWFWNLFETPPVQDPTAEDLLEEGLEGPVAQIQNFATDPEFAALLSTIGTVIGILLIVAIVYFAVRRFRQESKPRSLGDEDAISIAGSLSDYLKGFQDRARQVFEGMIGLNPAARLIAAARIRIIYARLLRLSARLGEPREPAATPIEFLSRLEKVFPASRDELESITNAYLRVRYGELPESRDQVEAVESAWSVVRRRGRSA